MTTNKILSLDHVSAGYNGKAKIMDICLDIHEHDFLLVTGHNGSGKTTMIRTMMGLIKPIEGRVLMWQNNMPVKNLNIGYLPHYNNIDKQFPISAFDTAAADNYKGCCSQGHWWQIRNSSCWTNHPHTWTTQQKHR